MNDILFIADSASNTILIAKQLKDKGITNIHVKSPHEDYNEDDFIHIEYAVKPNKQFGTIIDFGQCVSELGFVEEPYNPPDGSSRKEREEAKDSITIEEINGMVTEDLTEVNRNSVDVFIREMKANAKIIEQLPNEKVIALYESTTSLYDMVHCIFELNKRKTRIPYDKRTIQWIVDNFDKKALEHPELKRMLFKAVKTRGKKVVQQGKKLASLFYFIDWFIEQNAEQSYSFTQERTISVDSLDEIPF